jgi:GTPase-activating protein SAC7
LRSIFEEDVEGLQSSNEPSRSLLRDIILREEILASLKAAATASSDSRPKAARKESRLRRLSNALVSPFRKGYSNSPAKTKYRVTEPRPQGIFGVPLRQSITYANVAISLVDEHGQSYIYGYVPIVVAKCGVYLKEKG